MCKTTKWPYGLPHIPILHFFTILCHWIWIGSVAHVNLQWFAKLFFLAPEVALRAPWDIHPYPFISPRCFIHLRWGFFSLVWTSTSLLMSICFSLWFDTIHLPPNTIQCSQKAKFIEFWNFPLKRANNIGLQIAQIWRSKSSLLQIQSACRVISRRPADQTRTRLPG